MSAGERPRDDRHGGLSVYLDGPRAAVLGAFRRAAILFSGEGEALWLNGAAAPLLRLDPESDPVFSKATPGIARLRSFARIARPGDVLAEPLRLFVGGRLESLTAETMAIELAGGKTGLLTMFGKGERPAMAATLPPPPKHAPGGAAQPAENPAHSPDTAFVPPVPKRPARAARFIFLTDAAGTILSLSPAFETLTGSKAADVLGAPLSEVIADIDPAQAATIARALYRKTGFADVVVDWPGEDGEVSRIALSASPMLEGDGFGGLNGFGAVAARAPAPDADASDRAHDRAEEAQLAAQLAADAAEDHGLTADMAEEDPETGAAAASAPAPAAASAPAPTPAPAAADEAHPAAPQHTLKAEAGADASPPAAKPPQQSSAGAAERAPAKQDNAPLRSLAGSVDASLGTGKIVPLKPSRPAAGAAGLSHSERNAFREIARALGARMEDDEADMASAPAKPADEAMSAAPALPPSGETPKAPVDEPPAPQATAKDTLADPAPATRITRDAETADIVESVEAVLRAADVPELKPVAPPESPFAAPHPGNRVAAAQAEISRALSQRQDEDKRSGEDKPQSPLADILMERVPVGILVFRGDRPLYLNRSLLDLLGYQDLKEFDALRGLDKLFRGRAAPSLSTGEYDTVTIMGRDGQTRPVDAHLQAIDWNGQHATMVSFRRALDAEAGPRVRSLDMELKARQAELAETRAMLDTATDGVISLDESGRILALNKAAEALFGYDQNELAGERLTLLLSPESHAAALDYIDGLKSGGVASVLNDGREVMGRERKGGRIPLFMTIGRISDTTKLAAVVRDLTAWKRAESELTEAKRAAERSSALKSDFLAKVSHEIRTPMNAIIGFAEVMRDERLGPIGTERYKDYLKDIHTSGEHVISLVNDLLDLSKIEAGRLELSFGSVDLNAIVTSCLGIMQPQATRDRVIMRSQLSAKLPPVVADERSVRQIVLNLLSNASKFTEAGGQVIISTALTEAGEAVIRVRDTGVGMTDQDIQAAMEPFRQLSNARGRGGTGLGLPLTKALVEANRAAFIIRSKVREGTLVEVVFPPTRVLAE